MYAFNLRLSSQVSNETILSVLEKHQRESKK